MGQTKNEFGNEYGHLKVFARGKLIKGQGRYWWCYCSNCGNFTEARGTSLRYGTTKSCGCTNSKPKPERVKWLVGETFYTPNYYSLYVLQRYRDGRWVCLCSCGNITIVGGWELQNGITTSCGCRQRALSSKRWSGENNPSWEGGINPGERDTTKTNIWRTSVFKRDNYTCQCCGQRGGELNAHHIRSWIEHPELRYDIDNGITMCWDCHMEKGVGFHSIYGYKNNTPGQLWSFMLTREVMTY